MRSDIPPLLPVAADIVIVHEAADEFLVIYTFDVGTCLECSTNNVTHRANGALGIVSTDRGCSIIVYLFEKFECEPAAHRRQLLLVH